MTDFRLEGVAIDFEFARTYRSQVAYNGVLGPGWTHTYDQRIWSDGQGGILHLDATRFALHAYPASGSAGLLDCATPGVYRKARSLGSGTWELRDAHGLILRFRPLNSSATSGKLDRIVDTFGNQLVVAYDAQGYISHVETDRFDASTAPTRRVDFVHSNGRLTSLLDVHNGRTWSFQYDSDGRLVQADTPAVETWVGGSTLTLARSTRYAYQADPPTTEHLGNLVGITYPGHTFPDLELTYDSGDHVTDAVVRAEDVAGAAPKFTLAFAALSGGAEVLETTVTDRRGFVSRYRFDAVGHATTVIDPVSNTSTYTYNADGERTTHVKPAGNIIQWTYASSTVGDRFQHGNVAVQLHTPAPGKPGSQAPYRIQRRYEPIYNQLLDTVDEGGTTVFDYEEDPQYVAGLINTWGILAPTIQALGDVNGDGRVDQHGGAVVEKSSPPITSGLPSGTVGSVVRTETWTFDDSGRVISHVDGEGALTTFDYADGFLSATTEDLDPEPSGCPNGAGSFPNSGTSRWTKPCSIDHVQALTQVIHDGRGNIVTVIDARGVASSFVYNDLDELVSSTLADGYVPARLTPELTALVQAGYAHHVAPGIAQSYDYDAAGRLVRIERDNRWAGDPANPSIVLRVAYDMAGRRTRVEEDWTSGTASVTEFFHDAAGNESLCIDAMDGVTARLYDEQDRLIEMRNGAASDGSLLPDTSVTTYTYDENGLRTRVEGPEDLDGDGQHEATLYEYDGRDHLHRVIAPVGTETILSRGSRGWGAGSQTLGRLGGPSPTSNSTAGNVVLSSAESERNEVGEEVVARELRFALGQAPGTTGPETHFAYDRVGRVVERTDALGHVTRVEYDGLGRAVSVTDDLGNVTRERFDAGGYRLEIVQEEIDPFGGPTVARSTMELPDGLGRVLRTITAGEVTFHAYDAQGNEVVRADGRSSITQTDPLGLYSTGPVPRPGNTVRTTRTRTATGLSVQVQSDMWTGGTASGSYDPWAVGLDPATPPTGVPLVEFSTIRHDFVGNVLEVVSAGGLAMAFQYDSQHRMTVKTFPDGSSTLTTYWRNGLVRSHSLRDASGAPMRTVETTYDASGRRTNVEVTAAPQGYEGTTSQSFEWNGLDLVTRATDDKASPDFLPSLVERTYDSLGRLTSETQDGFVVASSYDDLYPTGFSYPDGREIGWNTDALGRLDEVVELGSGSPIADYSYFGSFHRVAEVQFGNGTSKSYRSAPSGSGLANGYSGSGRPLRIDHRAPGGSLLSVFSNTYDSAGNRTQRVRDVGGSLTGDAAMYDSRQRIGLFDELVSSTLHVVKGILRDADGNWTALVAQEVPNAVSAYAFVSAVDDWYYTHVAGRPLEHDLAGNRTGDDWFTYEYDAFDRLIRVRSAKTDEVVGSYSYDAFTRRTAKYDWLNGLMSFVYDGDRIIEVRDDRGSVVDQFVHGLGLDELVQWTDASGAVRYFLTDDMGSVVGLTDSNGAVVERVSYDAFGAPVFRDASGAPVVDGSGQPVLASPLGNRFLFQGRDYDAELALWRRAEGQPGYFAEAQPAGQYNYRYRYVSPEEGRFVGRDPLAMANNGSIDPAFLVGRILRGESETPYELNAGSPINRLDPYGLAPSGRSTLELRWIDPGGEPMRIIGPAIESEDDLAVLYFLTESTRPHVAGSLTWHMPPCGGLPGGEGGGSGGGRSGGAGRAGGGGGGGSGAKPPSGGSSEPPSGGGNKPAPPSGRAGGAVRRVVGGVAKAAGPVASGIESIEASRNRQFETFLLTYLTCNNMFMAGAAGLINGLESRSGGGMPAAPMPPRTGSESLKMLAEYRELEPKYDESFNPNTGRRDADLNEKILDLRNRARAISCTVFSHLVSTNGRLGPITNLNCNDVDSNQQGEVGTGQETVQLQSEQRPDSGRSEAAKAALERLRERDRSPVKPTIRGLLALLPLMLSGWFGRNLGAR